MTNSSATFQTIINNIFWDFIVKDTIIVYLDNILIFIWTLKEYYKVICKVLEVLAEHKLFQCPKKYEFNKTHIKNLGLIILEDWVEIDSIKIAEVHNWSILTTYTNLQVFLSFTNFYQKFIYRFLNISHFLFNVIGSKSTWT